MQIWSKLSSLVTTLELWFPKHFGLKGDISNEITKSTFLQPLFFRTSVSKIMLSLIFEEKQIYSKSRGNNFLMSREFISACGKSNNVEFWIIFWLYDKGLLFTFISMQFLSKNVESLLEKPYSYRFIMVLAIKFVCILRRLCCDASWKNPSWSKFVSFYLV